MNLKTKAPSQIKLSFEFDNTLSKKELSEFMQSLSKLDIRFMKKHNLKVELVSVRGA